MKNSADMPKRKKIIAVILLSTFILLLVTAILYKSGILSRLFASNKIPELPPVFLYEADFSENIFDDAEYICLDRRVEYIEGAEDHCIENKNDCKSLPAAATFFYNFFDNLINGRCEKISNLFTSEYKKANGDIKPFTMQKIYDITVRRIYSDSEAVVPSGCIRYTFEVRYKIRKNNGTFRSNIASDCTRPQIYELFGYSDGSFKINSITDIF